MPPPQVSVCIPAYNYGHYLPEAIVSVLAQTFTDWELIICDDQSADDTETICRGYSDKDSRIRYFKNENRLGMPRNFRRTVEHSRGTYLKFLCADDWMHPDCLDACVELAEKYQSATLILAGLIDVNQDGKPITDKSLIFPKVLYKGSEIIRRQMFGLVSVGGNSSYFIPKFAYEKVGGIDPDFPYAFDNHLCMKLCQIGDVAMTNGVHFYGRHHDGPRPERDQENLDIYIGWLEMPRRIFNSNPMFSRGWWLKMIGIGRAGADHTLLAISRILKGKSHLGIPMLGVVIRWGYPYWPIIVALPWRFAFLMGSRFSRKFLKIPRIEVWRPPGFQITQKEKNF